MGRSLFLAMVIAAFGTLFGCEQIQDLLGSGDDGGGGDAVQVEGAQPTEAQPPVEGTPPVEAAPPQAAPPQEGQPPQAGQPQEGQQPQSGQPADNAPAGGDSVCSRASRCCDIASNVQNFPEMYAQQREAACRTIHENTNLNDDGCRTAMGIVRQLLRITNQNVPTECAE